MRPHPRLRLLAVIVLSAALLASATASAHGFAFLTDPPPFPENVRASDGTYSYKVRITWNASSGAATYRIFRAESLGGSKTSIGLTADTFYDDAQSLWALRIYYYWVNACDASNRCSGNGNDYSTPDTGYVGLATPTVSASDGTYTDKVRVTWSSIQGADSYTLYRGSSEAGYNVTIPNLTTTTYDDTSASPGVVYYYWVKAVSSLDDSGMGGPNTGYRNLTAPAVVAATDGTYSDKVRVTWSASFGATRHQVWRAPAAGGTAEKLAGVAATAYDDTTAVPGELYNYQIKGCNALETICSGLSAADSGYRALSAPSNLVASDGAYTDKVRVAWTAHPNAVSYTLYRGVTPGAYSILFPNILTNAYDDLTAVAGVQYYYAVKACAETGCGALSAGDWGYRSNAVPTPTATATATLTPTVTRTPTMTRTPTVTRTRIPGLQKKSSLPLVMK